MLLLSPVASIYAMTWFKNNKIVSFFVKLPIFFSELEEIMSKKDETIQKVVAELTKQAGKINDKAAHKFANYQLPLKAAPSKGTQAAITISIVLGGVALATALAGQVLHTLRYHRTDRGRLNPGEWKDEFEDRTEKVSRNVGRAFDDAADKVQDKVDDIADKVESATNDARKTVKKTVRKAK